MKSIETTSKPTITWTYTLENTKVMAMLIDIGEKEDVSSDTKITRESLVENCKFIVLRKQLSRMLFLSFCGEEFHKCCSDNPQLVSFCHQTF
jgi:hypothetical protein